MLEIKAYVKWHNQDGHGIAKDDKGYEYYFYETQEVFDKGQEVILTIINNKTISIKKVSSK